MERIIVVDDDETSRHSLVRILTDKGLAPDACKDASEALDKLETSGPYGLVLSDIHMPGLDGLDLVRRIVEIDPTVVNVLITGFTSESKILAAMRAGAFDFLSKPYTLDELDVVLTRARERRRVLLENKEYRQHLEGVVAEHEEGIIGTDASRIELYGPGREPRQLQYMGESLDELADYAMRQFHPETFGVFVLEQDAFSALALRDRSGRPIEGALLGVRSGLSKAILQGSAAFKELPQQWYLQKRNQWAHCWPLKWDSFAGYIYMGYQGGRPRHLERNRFGFELFRNQIASHLKEHHVVRCHQQQLRRIFVSSIQAHARSIEAKDPYTAGHTVRVSRYAEILARQAGEFSEDWIFDLKVGSILHDVGKIGIKGSILRKPTRLTEEESGEIQTHPVIGSRIVHKMYGLNLEASIRHHHEWFDGKGYPDGLEGDRIPIEARMVLAADTFDAMTSNRPYSQALPTEKAIDELRKFANRQFDPEVVKLMIDAAPALDEARHARAEDIGTTIDLAEAV